MRIYIDANCRNRTQRVILPFPANEEERNTTKAWLYGLAISQLALWVNRLNQENS